MRMADVILKKRNGGTLSREEIDAFVAGYTAGSIRVVGIPDKQDEFIAAKAPYDLIPGEALAQETPKLNNDAVSGVVAVRIVDDFETVDVQNEQKSLVRRGVRQVFVDLSGQRVFVPQAGHSVGVFLDPDLPGQYEFPDAEGVCDDIQKSGSERQFANGGTRG